MCTPQEAFGLSPITRPIFAFSLLLLATAGLELACSLTVVLASPFYQLPNWSGFAAMHWIATCLMFITSVFAIIVAFVHKNGRFNFSGSLTLAILSAITLVPCSGVMINDYFVLIGNYDPNDVVTPMSLGAALPACIFLVILIALSVAHAAKSSKTSM